MANNLLDKSSIILTPTAYNNGEALCVKPSDGSGDFDFSRNSAATRVNAQGLVENVQILSSNLVQNGDFSEEGVQEVSNGSFSQEGVQLVTNGDFATDTDWTKQTGWSISNGKAIANSSNGSIYQPINFIDGKSYKITFDISDYTSGEVACRFNNNETNTFNSVGSHTLYFVSNNSFDYVYFKGLNSFTGSIDNVSVREVGQDWTLGTGWSIGEDKAISDGTTSNLDQDNTLTIGKSYKAQFTISDLTTGTLSFRLGGSNEIININSNGTYTAYGVADGVVLRLRSQSGFDGSVTNISVKEVGQNWVLDANWSIAEDKAVSDGSVNGFIRTSNNLFENGKTYKVGLTVSNMTTGRVTYPYDGGGTNYIYTNGDFSQTYTPDDTNRCWIYGSNGFDGSITNISVIEITDDTNLPRINYEGFSYQDVLGSEEITNGDFATDSDWIKQSSWTISNGTANYDGISSGNYLRQSWSPLTIGKTYRMTFDISDGSAYLQIRSGTSLLFEGLNIVLYGTGSHVIEAKAISNLDNLRIYAYTSGGGTSFSIDNVSVKEVTGQEVVPDSGCGSWLWEPQSTNLITQSELFSDAVWTKVEASVTSGFSSPDGLTNAYKLIASVNNSNHRIRSAIIPTAAVGTTVTFSIYIKPQEITKIALVDNWTNLSYGVVNLTTNSVIEEAQGTTSVTEILNGFRRVSFTYQTANINTLPAVYLLDDGYTSGNPTSYTFASDGTSGVYIWGAQLEALSYATSMIPTSGSTVTRNQDLCNNGGSLASINSTEGTLYFEGSALANDGTARYLGLSDGTSDNRVVILYYSPINKIRFIIESEDVKYLDENFLLSDITEFHKVAISYKLNDFKVYVDGVLKINDTIGNTPIGLNVLSFDLGGSSPFFGKTKALAVWKEALSDSELQSLTTI